MDRKSRFKVGEWIVHPLSGELQRGELRAHVQPKSMDVLMCLVEHAPDVVERDALLEAVWGARAPTDEPLTRCIAELRKKFGDQRVNPSYIDTIPKRGYRLLAEVAVLESVPQPTRSALESTGHHKIPDRSIAVLPFTNLGADAGQRYLGDAIADEIQTRLSRVPDLKVAARISSARVCDQDHQSIRAALGVRFILDGSILHSGEHFKVNLRLADSSDGYQQLADSFDAEGEDLLKLQQDIAVSVFNRLPRSLIETPMPDWRNTETPNTRAVDLYLKGRYAFNQRNLPAAAEFLQQACDAGGNFASLYHVYAATLAVMPLYYLSSNPRATLRAATRLAEQALAIEPDLAHGLAVLGMICMVQHQWQKARDYFQQAIDNDPREPLARQWYGMLQLLRGNPADSLRHYEIVRDIDPLSPVVFRDIGIAYFTSGDYEQAEDNLLLARSLSVDDSRSWIPTFLGALYVEQARYGEAFDEWRRDQFLAALNDTELQQLLEAITRFKEGGESSELLMQMEARIPSPALAARLYALTGCQALALACLRRGVQDADPLITFSYIDPALEAIRQSPQGKLLFAAFSKNL